MKVQDNTLIRWGKILAGSSVAVGAVGMVLAPILDPDLLVKDFVAHNGLLAVGLGSVAWVTITAQPRNGAVWALVLSAVFGSLFVLSNTGGTLLAKQSIADFSYETTRNMSPSDLPTHVALAFQPAIWGWVPAVFGMLTLGVMLFPDGRAPSPRWKWLGWYSAIVMIVAAAAQGWLFRPSSTVRIGAPSEDYPGIAGEIADVTIFLLMLGALLSVVALIVRYRRSSGVARKQIRWIGLGGASITLILFASFIVEDSINNPGSVADEYMVVGGEVLLIGSFVVAITKYRLYDIDVVISKTVTYVSLAGVITLLYTAIVLGPVLVLGASSEGGPDLALAIAATALVAVAFEPIRSRLQRWANRLVYGERATPYEVLSGFTAQLSAPDATGEGLVGLAQLLQEGTGAESAVVWLRVGDRLRAEAASPPDAVPHPAEVESEAELPRSQVAVSLPVRHGGELLGAVSIAKAPNDPATPADEALLADVAAGAGLVLQNLRLNAELAERADELRASRRRLIAAHDAARHRLERDLHDGAQQQVVALKVKLGLAKTIAEREGATDLAAAVARLSDGTQDAVDAMRMVARGIYPPLLEAEGLAAALGAAQRTSELPVQINSDGITRYSRRIEETVYFCVLAAINLAAMAGAASVRIGLRGDDSSLTFSAAYDIADHRPDLTPLTDRIDALGGSVTSTSSEVETTLAAELPVGSDVMEPV